jgi:tetratricopeptide (TPR) repeat protein
VACGTKLVADGEVKEREKPVSMERSRGGSASPRGARAETIQDTRHTEERAEQESEEDEGEAAANGRGRRARGGMPVPVGVVIAAAILCLSAGGTYFFLTKPPENERLLQEGQKQLQNGQYAFALKTLTEAVHMKPDSAKALLALARAYVGVDQVDKAWECITKAQQLGAGVVADPQLASDLANYYRQHNQCERAIELLRPLANSNVPGKRAELADLDATWGDDALRDGDLKSAMKCWEEVRDLHEGSRFMESESRLATIYQKIAVDMVAKGDTDEALKFYGRLNAYAPSSSSYERTSELYEKAGKLELAIDQMRHAQKLGGGDSQGLRKRLAALMARRGKDLLDNGDTDAGYGYLQQAQSLDPQVKAPPATVRNTKLSVDNLTGLAHFVGEVWNPGPSDLNYVSLKTEIYDTVEGKSLSMREQHIIDEFVPPLPARESRPFDIPSPITVKTDGSQEMRVYLNGTLYKAYNIGDKKPGKLAGSHSDAGTAQLRPRIDPGQAPPSPSPSPFQPESSSPNGANPPLAPNTVKEHETTPPPAPSPVAPAQPQPGPPGLSPEEKTLKDLE